MSARNPYSCLGQGLVPVCLSEWPYSQECPGVHCTCMDEKRSRLREPPCSKPTIPAPTFCRCGAPRIPTLNHLFINEDLSKVPSRFRYGEGKYRSVCVDGRTYFLLQSEFMEPIWTDAQYRASRRRPVPETVRGADGYYCKYDHDTKEERVTHSHQSPDVRPGDRRTTENVRNFSSVNQLRKMEHFSNEKLVPSKENQRLSRPGSARRFTQSVVPRGRRYRNSTSRSKVDHRPVPRVTKSLVNSALSSNRFQSRSEFSDTADSRHYRRKSESHFDRPVRCPAQKQGRDRKTRPVESWRHGKDDGHTKVSSNVQKHSAPPRQDGAHRRPRRYVRSNGRPRPRLATTTENSLNEVTYDKRSHKSTSAVHETSVDQRTIKKATTSDKFSTERTVDACSSSDTEKSPEFSSTRNVFQKSQSKEKMGSKSADSAEVISRIGNRLAGGEGDADNHAASVK